MNLLFKEFFNTLIALVKYTESIEGKHFFKFYCFSYYHNLFKTLLATSTPKKHAALAGNALSMAGPNPLNRAGTPSARTVFFKSFFILAKIVPLIHP